jgi:O-antigen/teichoic acid export membrane protein
MSETAAASSQRQIVFSTAIMGSASAVGLILSLIRTKVFALLLGPAGIGLLGLLNNLLSSAALLAGLGVGTSGVRHVAEAAASEDRPAIARARAVLFAMTGALALLGGALLWLLREPIARHLLGDPALSGMVGWLALGLAFTLAAGAQVALLNGMRRVADLARLQVAGALAATVVGIAAVAVWGAQALVAVVIAVPLTAFVVGAWFVRRLRLPREAVVARELAREGLKLARDPRACEERDRARRPRPIRGGLADLVGLSRRRAVGDDHRFLPPAVGA